MLFWFNLTNLIKTHAALLLLDYVASEIRFFSQNTITDTYWSGDITLAPRWDKTSPNFKISRNFSAYTEAFGYLTQKQHATLWVDGGFKYLITKNLQVNISGG